MKNKTIEELGLISEGYGLKSYCARYIFNFIHQKNSNSIEAISTLKKDFRNKLAEDGFFISQLQISKKQTDPDGTVKYLFRTGDGNFFESVLLNENGRRTICVSTQIGCKMGCKFCATSYIKFKRNLTAGEISDQINIISADTDYRINNIVYMGMGEPLENYDNILRAVNILCNPFGKNIGIRRQTISTVGVIEGINKLASEKIHPRLAVSLHAADDELRKKIVPSANKYPLTEILNALQNYCDTTGRRVTIEYCMLSGVNDSTECARKLISILRNIDASVNLIEYNPHNSCDFRPSDKSTIKTFKDILMSSSIETIVRFRRGRSIKAACGQLGAETLTLKTKKGQ